MKRASYDAAKLKLPTGVGLSLKPQHFHHILQHLPPVDFFEIHPENYMSPGGPHLTFLEKIREHYPLSMHGVGMSLGSADGIQAAHLQHLHTLVQRFEPLQVSEHLSWARWGSVFLNDLLPLPYTDESLGILQQNIQTMQDYLQRSILIENPSVYLDFETHTYSETAFLNTLCQTTGCGLLLDLNNIVVSAFNNGFDAREYLENINTDFVGEVHLAGHKDTRLNDNRMLKIDDHGASVADEVWQLLGQVVEKKQTALPLLVEWDTNIPEFSVLQTEADKARKIMWHTLANREQDLTHVGG